MPEKKSHNEIIVGVSASIDLQWSLPFPSGPRDLTENYNIRRVISQYPVHLSSDLSYNGRFTYNGLHNI